MLAAADPLSLVTPVIFTIDWILTVVSTLAGVFAAVDAASRRPDAFAAADRQSKGVWTGITVACAVGFGLGLMQVAAFGPLQLLWLAAVVGTLVYLLDVRPRLREVQRGSRW